MEGGGHTKVIRKHVSGSYAAVVRVPASRRHCQLGHKEGDGAQEAHQSHDKQLPVEYEVVTVEESHGCRDGLQWATDILVMFLIDTRTQ